MLFYILSHSRVVDVSMLIDGTGRIRTPSPARLDHGPNHFLQFVVRKTRGISRDEVSIALRSRGCAAATRAINEIERWYAAWVAAGDGTDGGFCVTSCRRAPLSLDDDLSITIRRCLLGSKTARVLIGGG